MNVRRLCIIITSTVREYYKSNKDKFSFLSCNIFDWDEITEKINGLDKEDAIR